jgi:hypothetical protein
MLVPLGLASYCCVKGKSSEIVRTTASAHAVEPANVSFDFQMSVQRIHESPRVTLPYSDDQWNAINALGRKVGSLPNLPRPPGDEVLSSKFPYRLSALLEPHLSEHGLTDTLDAAQLTDLFTRELNHVIAHQRGPAYSADSAADTLTRLRESLLTYLGNLPGTPTEKLKQLLGLLATAAFLGRQPALKS